MIKVTAFGDLDSQSTGLDATQTIRSCVKVFINPIHKYFTSKKVYIFNYSLFAFTLHPEVIGGVFHLNIHENSI